MDLEHDAVQLLDRLNVLRHPSDLDLLMFFARHPRSLLSSEQLALFLGYGVQEIAASLDLLLNAGFLTRTQSHRHAARMYVFAIDPPGGNWLPAVKQLASTRAGRLALVWAIRRRSPTGGATQTMKADDRKPAALQLAPRSSAREPQHCETANGPHPISLEPPKRGGGPGDR